LAAQVHLIRYADDFIITAHSKEVLEFEVKPLVEAFIAERGLVLSSEKTLITQLSAGFDFLGQNVRRYSNGKLLIKPARKSIAAFLTKIREIVRAHRGSTAHLLITKLNPVIRGWAMHHRHVVSKRTFTHVDRVLWQILWQWAKPRHPNKGLRWIKRKYFERVGTRNWIFHGDSATGGLASVSRCLGQDRQARSGAFWPQSLRSRLGSLHRASCRSSLSTVRVHPVGIRGGLSRVSWKLSRTVLRGGTDGNVGSLLDQWRCCKPTTS
jgi:hypothetical protein